MKKILILGLCLSLFLLSCGMNQNYDDSELRERIESLEKSNEDLNDRVEALEKIIQEKYSVLFDELEDIISNYQQVNDCKDLITALEGKVNSLESVVSEMDTISDSLVQIQGNIESLKSTVELLKTANSFILYNDENMLLFNSDKLLLGVVKKEYIQSNAIATTIFNPILLAKYNEESFFWVHGCYSRTQDHYGDTITYYTNEDYLLFKTRSNNTATYRAATYLIRKTEDMFIQHVIKNQYAYDHYSNSYYYPGYASKADSLEEFIALYNSSEYQEDSNYSITTTEVSFSKSSITAFSYWKEYLYEAMDFYKN